MELLLGFLLGIVGGLITNYISPPVKRSVESILGRFFHLLNPDRFDLTGTWEQTFTEPATDRETWEEIKETVLLRHLGGTVSGRGVTQDNGRLFRYDLRVQHNLVFGSYTKSGARGNLTGNGVIQMIVSPDRLSMKGQATWFDNDTERIESSDCLWSKTSSALESPASGRAPVPGRPVPAPQQQPPNSDR
ncbi:MAG TPA: hypothetical protein VK548_19030 [Candidatus Acidoferrum sp.]|nr:hypothetical protein [Candidatus Acidoferrum sp.]